MVFVSPFTMVAFRCLKANFMEICEKIFLLRFKANYLEKMHGYRSFSLWIPIALSKIYFYRVVLTWWKNLCI